MPNSNPAAAAAAAIQDNEHIPMIIDLGSHWLDGLGSTVLPGNPALALQVGWGEESYWALRICAGGPDNLVQVPEELGAMSSQPLAAE